MADPMTEDDEIQAALMMLDQPLHDGSANLDLGEPIAQPSEQPLSPTLAALDEGRRPKGKTVCETCPHSVWFASTSEVKCYCRVMFLVTWSTREPNVLTHCDGPAINQD